LILLWLFCTVPGTALGGAAAAALAPSGAVAFGLWLPRAVFPGLGPGAFAAQSEHGAAPPAGPRER
jgi:hypothetical protein